MHARYPMYIPLYIIRKRGDTNARRTTDRHDNDSHVFHVLCNDSVNNSGCKEIKNMLDKVYRMAYNGYIKRAFSSKIRRVER